MNDPNYILGIDPDIEKSGFALLDVRERTFTVVKTMNVADSVKYLDYLGAMLHLEYDAKLLVVIEDSDTSTSWHLNRVLSSGLPLMRKLRTAAAIGRSAGLCHAVSRVLKEYAESCGLEVKMQKPLRKCWKGQNGKITQLEAVQFMNGLPNRTNQECRDAALIAWNVAELPIRMKAKK